MPKRAAANRDRCRRLVLGAQRVSEGELASVLKRVAANPDVLEDLPQRRELSRIRAGVSEECMDSESLDLDAGGTWQWHVVSMVKLLPSVLRQRPGLTAV